MNAKQIDRIIGEARKFEVAGEKFEATPIRRSGRSVHISYMWNGKNKVGIFNLGDLVDLGRPESGSSESIFSGELLSL